MRARRRAGRTLAAAAMLLSAAAGESTSASTVVVLYSDANCASTPTKISFQANASCSAADAVDCSSEVSTNPDAQTYYYYTKECAEDYVEFAEETFGSDAFLLLNYYNTSGCDDWYAAILYPLDGKCHATDVYGTSGAIADMADNGTVTIDWYDDSTCRGSSNNSFVVEGDAVANEECVKDVYTFVVYNTDDESSSGSSETPTSSAKYGNESDESASAASSTTTVTSGSDGNSKLGTGSIVGIIIAAIIVVALAVASVFYYRRKSSDVKIKRQGSVQLLEDVSQKLHRTPTVSKQSRRSNTVSTQRHHSTQGDLWDDEVIIAARIPREKVLVGDLISRGGYGEVYLGSYNSQQVAVKMLLPETKRKMRYVNDFLAEIKMVAILEHSCIVQFVGVAWDSLMDLCVVCEYMEGGDLRSLLESFEEAHHPQGFDYEKVKIAKQVVHALTYLHSLQPMVLHRDLKSRNVLLNNVMDAKLTDFGVSRERQDRTMTAGVGTSLWMAPEVMMGGRYDDKADMFSFGVLLTELDSHLLPYSNTRDPMRSSRKLPDTAILQMVVAGSLTVTFSPNCLKSIVQLGTECVSMNPEDRPTAAQALGRLHTISVQEVEQSPGVMFSI